MESNTSLYELEAVPDDIKGKLALLSMVEPDHFIEGVGYKYSDAIYYVFA